MRRLPPQDVLNAILDYNPETGVLTWKRRDSSFFQSSDRFSQEALANIWNGKNAGKPALQAIHDRRYYAGSVLGERHLAHRVIWKMATGEEPKTIDHINGDTTDNRLKNLRSISISENLRNKSLYWNNKSGTSGITKTPHGKWKVQIGNGGRQIYIGCFDDFEGALLARREAEECYGYHANHGRT